jgi:hypothetical protein
MFSGDLLDWEYTEFAEQNLVVHTPERGGVDDALRAGAQPCEVGEGGHGGGGSVPGEGTQSTSRMTRPWT